VVAPLATAPDVARDDLGRARRRRATTLWLLGLGAGLLVTLVLGIGAVSVPPATTAAIIGHHLLGVPDAVTWSASADSIVWQVRLPRVLLGATVGAGLAVAGVALQAMVRNVLADPYLLGLTSGASTGAAAAILFGFGSAFGANALAGSAFLGAMSASLAVDAAPDEGRTAAVLYPTVGGGAGYAYGTRSMAHPQLEAAGFGNAVADVDERVFEVTLEELLDRDPDALVLLYGDGDPGLVEDEIRGLPGADGLTAVQDDAILVQLFNFTEPPTSLSVDGLETIVSTFGRPG
jgi:hypothetical protein